MSKRHTLDFEKPLAEIEHQIEALQSAAARNADTTGEGKGDDGGFEAEIGKLREAHERMLATIYKNLSPWNTVRVARHPRRPQTRDYIRMICKDFCEIHGDRRFGDDPAIVTGFARIGSIKCLVVGHQKGKETEEKLDCHFGCAHPEGYRKAMAKMKIAEKFNLPIVTFVDTPGAYPGLGAEERGQAEAIAYNLREMSRLKTPVISIVIGEGGSGGALGIAVADRVAMLQHSWYSVISPEGCAAILWKEANEQTNNAAAKGAPNLTAAGQPQARASWTRSSRSRWVAPTETPKPPPPINVQRWIVDRLRELRRFKPANLPRRRYERFRKFGEHEVETRARIEIDCEDRASDA